MRECGGCRGLGAHHRYCPQHPDYHPWQRLVAAAEDIGDSIGSNDPGLSNQAYALAARLREVITEHPWRGLGGGPR